MHKQPPTADSLTLKRLKQLEATFKTREGQHASVLMAVRISLHTNAEEVYRFTDSQQFTKGNVDIEWSLVVTQPFWSCSKSSWTKPSGTW